MEGELRPIAFQSNRCLVIGDVMLDRHIFGAVGRISPEAPVPVVAVNSHRSCLGGAGHVAASLAGLECQVALAGVIGGDAEGREVRRIIQGLAAIEDRVVESANAATVSKTRILAASHQQLLRLDRDGSPEAFSAAEEELWASVEPLIGEQDVVVVADYDKGALPERLLAKLIAACKHRGIACVVDGKRRDVQAYQGATAFCPNLFEVERALGRSIKGNGNIAEAAARLRESLALDYMIITRGADGMTLSTADGATEIPAVSRDVADVTGAGDTVVATLSACLAAGWDIEAACRLSAMAAGIAVAKPGAYVVRRAELEAVHSGRSPKILDREAAATAVRAAQKSGRRVVFTNGCFDIFHAGHLSCLERARGLGDLLVVGLNSDVSVKLNKGASRPIIGEDNRAALLAGLACVDMVVVFDEDRPELLVRQLAPDILVKGSDYAVEDIAGAAFVISRGGQVITLPLVPGLSTTALLSSQREVAGRVDE